MLYQRVKLKAVTGSSGNYQLIDTPHGWLDFCPDKDAQFCLD